MVMGNIIENCRECSYPQGVMIWDCDVVFAVFFRRKPQVASTLTGDFVTQRSQCLNELAA